MRKQTHNQLQNGESMNKKELPKGLILRKANIILEHSRLSGNWVAKCEDCKFVSAYWEEDEELEHDCEEH